MTISRRLRFEILRRDNHTCRYCGQRAPDVPLTVDHVIPVSLGGRDDPANLVAACRDCNAGKTSVAPGSELVTTVSDDAVKWARALQEAAYWASIDREVAQQSVEAVDAAWNNWTYTVEVDGSPTKRNVSRPADWIDTVRRFHSVGLASEAMVDLIGVAMRRPQVSIDERWTYFCGCCWRAIDDLQQTATDIAKANEQLEHRGRRGGA